MAETTLEQSVLADELGEGYNRDWMKELMTDAEKAKPDEEEEEKMVEQYGDICKTEEDLLSCVLFPQVAPDYIRRRVFTRNYPEKLFVKPVD